MSAAVRDYVYEIIVEEDDKPIPAISKEQLDSMVAEAAEYPQRES